MAIEQRVILPSVAKAQMAYLGAQQIRPVMAGRWGARRSLLLKARSDGNGPNDGISPVATPHMAASRHPVEMPQ